MFRKLSKSPEVSIKKSEPPLLLSTYLLLACGLIGLLIIVAVISLWRHKKAGIGPIQLLGAAGIAQTNLDPEGAVLIQGELWRARSIDGTTIAAEQPVEVVRVEGLFLLVRR